MTKSVTLYVQEDRRKAIWKAWQQLAVKTTPPNPSGYTMKPSTLFALIGEAMINDPQKVTAAVQSIIGTGE